MGRATSRARPIGYDMIAIPILITNTSGPVNATSMTVLSCTPSATATITGPTIVGSYQLQISDDVAGTSYAVVVREVIPGLPATMDITYTLVSPGTTVSGALTTLAAAKLYMGITDTTQDSKLTALLSAASDAIENYCERVFASDSLVEYFDGRDNWRNGYLHLKRTPVTSITRIASEPQVALTVLNANANADMATVQVTTTGVVLTAVVAGTSSSTTLLFANYTTINTLATAITNAGWTAVVAQTNPNFGTFPSTYLRQPQGALSAKSAPLSNGAQLMIYTRELAVADIDYDEGTIYGFFPKGFQHAEVRYVAGYATIPNAVQTACCMVVKALNDQSKNDATLQYEKLGDYSWGRRTDQLISLENAIFADALPLLRKYKRIAAM